MVRGLTIVLLLAPLVLWAVHIFWLVPRLDRTGGREQMILGFGFFFISGAVMIVCEILSIVALVVTRYRPLAVAVVLNLSWLYYLKVIAWGPTIGNL
jgi:hypothetical protein